MTRIYPDPLDMEEDSQMYDRADHELRSRTSWVDAELAYKQIVKGKALGNSCALYIRARLQNRLFYLGGVIQRHPLKTLFLGLLALALCCVGLKAARMETDIQHLWVEEGGRLSQEIEYTRSLLGEDSAAFNELLLVQTPRRGGSSVDVESLLLHQKALQAATEITVDMFDINWKLKDICYTVGFPSYEDRMFDRLLEQLMPCLIITPLDCFWEGSKALGPEYALAVPSYHGYIKWTNLNPYDLVLSIAENLNTFDFVTDAVLGIMHRGGVTSGYQEKPCLNPHDPECPVTAPNWQNKQDPEVGAELTGGCNGFAPKYMHWEEDLIMGGITRNDTGHIVRAEALQSIIQLMGAHEFYKLYKDDNKVHSVDWTLAKAQEVLQTWQRKYTEVVSEMVNTTHRDALHPFSSTSLVDMLTEFSQISFFRVGIGYALMLVYVCISLLKRTDAIRSQAGVGVAGVLLVALSVAAGLGLCSAIGISFNASTTQIIPFLALGLGVNDMFMMVHTYAEVAENLKIPLEDQIGACLKRVGISVVLTSVSNACAFFMAAIIPIPALRAFTLQTGVLVLFNLFTIMTVFPAVLTIDLLRRDKKRVDVFCCFTGYSSPPLAENIELGSRSSSTTIHRSRDPSPPPPYHSQDLLTSQPQRHHRMETRIRRDGSSVTKLTRDPKSYAGSHSSISTFSTQTTEASTEDKKCCVCKCWSLSQLAKHLYAPQLMKTSHKFFVLFIFMVLLGLGVLGTLRVEDGLDLTDVVPRDTREHQYLDAQAKYFGFYNMYAVTKDFDYPNNQQMLYDFHDSFKDVDAIIKREDGSLPPFWLHMFRDWLLDIQEALRLDIADGCIHRGGWYNNATGDGVLGYKLIIQTGDSDPRQRENRDRVLSGALVDDEGIIYPPAFYTLLSAWTSNDALAYAASEANFVPAPREWFYVGDNNDFMIPRSQSLTYAQMPFHLHRMVSTGYITSTIRHIRRICEEYVSDGLPNFPCGIPFTYWEQYLNLRFYLYLSLGCVLLGVFLVLAASLMNVWIAGVVVLVLAVMVVELFGLMGILGIKLSAIPAVILIVSVGIGVEFTVHVCMGFLTSLGSRNHRAIVSLEHTFAPVLHGAISTLLGIVMLAGAEFDFVFKYFFIELFALIVLGLINGLVILPVLLSLIGPRGEVISREHPYLMSLPTPPPSPKAARAKTQKKAKKSSSSKTSSSSKKVYLHTRPHRDSLTTISEEPTQYSSSDVIVCQPEVYVETVPTVRTNYYPSNDTDGSDYASPNSQVTTVKTTATVKVKVRTPLQDGKHSGKPKRRRPIPSPPSTAANLSDSDCSSDQPRPEKPRPRQLRPKKPRPDRPLYDLLDRSEFSDTQFDHLEREYAPQPPQRTSSRSIEGRQYKRVPRYPGATQQLQQLTTDSDTDRSSETDIKYTTHGAKSNKSNPTYSPYKQSGPSQGHPVDPAVTLNTSRSRAAESCGMREVPAVFSSAISPAPTSSDTPTAIDTPPAPPTRCKQIVVKPYRGCSDTDSDLSISSTDDVTTDDEDRRVLEACEFSDTEASLA